jgi:EAL domain-containing protein (putative c-di-GMP-specific phosphodiesterase class I)
MSNCPGCEMLPAPLTLDGDLFLWPPLGHTLSKIHSALAAAKLDAKKVADDCLCVAVSERLYEVLREIGRSQLGQVERDHCKYLILATGCQPTIGDFGRVQSFTHLLAHITGRWLVELLAEHRLVTLFQPIVHSTDPGSVFGHECLIRGIEHSGALIGPAELYGVGRDANLLYYLDRAARLQHIKAAQEYDLQSAVFINFNPTAVYDPQFCLRSTIAAIKATRLVPEQIVFEVVESDRIIDLERLPQVLDVYRREGFRIALDDVGAGYSSLNMLSTLKPDFIKLDMHLVRDIDHDIYKRQIVSSLITTAHNLGIQVVAEGVETVSEWNWVTSAGADFTQGFLFGKPELTPLSSFCATLPV